MTVRFSRIVSWTNSWSISVSPLHLISFPTVCALLRKVRRRKFLKLLVTLKGQCHEILRPNYFLWTNPSKPTDWRVKVISNMASILRGYSYWKIELFGPQCTNLSKIMDFLKLDICSYSTYSKIFSSWLAVSSSVVLNSQLAMTNYCEHSMTQVGAKSVLSNLRVLHREDTNDKSVKHFNKTNKKPVYCSLFRLNIHMFKIEFFMIHIAPLKL